MVCILALSFSVLKQAKTILMSINPNIKASSLTNAIFICLIISIFCGSLVLISHYQNILNDKLGFQEQLINTNNSSFNFFVNNLETFSANKIQELDVFENGITSYGQKKNWGFYNVLVCKTIFKKDTISKIALIGELKNNKNSLALYVTDYDKPLKLSGDTKIYGNQKVSAGRTGQAYINGKKGNSIKIRGAQSKSDDKLPKLDTDLFIDVSNYKTVTLNSIIDKTIINGFDEDTKVVDLNGVSNLSDITCKGNLILNSSSSIQINRTANLNDVLVMAPEVFVQSGFSGNIQIVAKEVVEVEPNVKLKYPSSIYIKNDVDSVSVKINKNSTILGGIVIDGNTYSGSLKRKLIIEEDATIVGNVYCYGNTQLQGEVIGSVYTDRFFLKTQSSNYENVILNGIINRDSLPNNFIELPLFKQTNDDEKYAIIKEF